MKRRKSSSGQALLIILLVLSVALTAGLALVTRTITDISISEKETASSKAFEAAEAGIEEALKAIEVGQDLPSSPLTLNPGGEEATVTIGQSEAVGELDKRQISPGQTTTFWLGKISLGGEDFPADINYVGDKLTLCWSGADNLEAAVYYQQGISYKVDRYYLAGGTGCRGLEKGAAIDPLPEGKKFVNVRVYNTTSPNGQVTVTADESLPRQGTLIEAEAKVGDVVRKISVFEGWPQVPQFFDFAVLSAGSLTKTE